MDKLTIDDLNMALREHEIAGIEDVSIVVMETDGSISFLRKNEMPKATKSYQVFEANLIDGKLFDQIWSVGGVFWFGC